jgi:hypothetical protein
MVLDVLGARPVDKRQREPSDCFWVAPRSAGRELCRFIGFLISFDSGMARYPLNYGFSATLL